MTEMRMYLANGVIVEHARVEDVPEIVDLHKRLYVPTYKYATPELTEGRLRKHVQSPKTRDRIRAINTRCIISPDRAVVFVARSESELVGYGVAEIDEQTGRHKNSGLYVSRPGEGIGRVLTRERVLWHNRMNKQPVPIYLNVAPKTSAVDFHEHLGFQLTGSKIDTELEEGYNLPLVEMMLSVKRQHLALIVK